MTLGIVALTPRGLELARKVAVGYPDGAHIYCPSTVEGGAVCITFTEPLNCLVQELFVKYKKLAFVMSLGIVVRIIAPCIKDKYTDPAVVVIDEKGEHAISVLSGHLGGANSLAAEIAALTGAKPVITTASDLQGKIALDVLARDKNLVIEPKENLKFLNSALVKGEKVVVYCDNTLQEILDLQALIGNWAEVLRLEDQEVEASRAVAFITNRRIPEPNMPYIYLRPKNLSVGVGCRAGTTKEEILRAINEALAMTGRSLLSVHAICSIDIKAEEQGLLQAADVLKVPLKFFSASEINNRLNLQEKLSKSNFVLEKIGVEGVCEPTALLGGNSAHLILPKTRWPKVTVAIAEDNWQL